jgi:hypothetical protein
VAINEDVVVAIDEAVIGRAVDMLDFVVVVVVCQNDVRLILLLGLCTYCTMYGKFSVRTIRPVQEGLTKSGFMPK